MADDADAVGWKDNRFMLVVPADAIVLVTGLSEDLDDLAATSRLSVDTAGLEPVTDPRLDSAVLGGHEGAPIGARSKHLPDQRTSASDARRDAEIYGFARCWPRLHQYGPNEIRRNAGPPRRFPYCQGSQLSLPFREGFSLPTIRVPAAA